MDPVLSPQMSFAMWLWVGAFTENLVRYLLPCALLSLVFATLPAVAELRLQAAQWSSREQWRDFGASVLFGALAAAISIPIAHAQLRGLTRIYSDPATYGWAYLGVSFLLVLVIHDAYFYWTHRLLHWGPVFRIAHARHHQARTPSVWTAFAFHPLESLVQLGIYPLIVFVVPIHSAVFALFLVYTAFYSAIIHCGHDILLDGQRGPLARWLYTTLDHDAHHLRGHGGYALYFGWWDTWMRTRVDRAGREAAVAAGGRAA